MGGNFGSDFFCNFLFIFLQTYTKTFKIGSGILCTFLGGPGKKKK